MPIKRVLQFLLLLWLPAAHAQGQPFDFNGLPVGVTAGATAKQYFARYPFHACKPGWCTFDIAQCTSRKIDHCAELSTWSGVQFNNLRAQFVDGKLGRVILGYSPAHFDEMVASLRQKYGPPESDRAILEQTMAGEPVTDHILLWRSANTSLSVRKYNIVNIKEGTVVIQSLPPPPFAKP